MDARHAAAAVRTAPAGGRSVVLALILILAAAAVARGGRLTPAGPAAVRAGQQRPARVHAEPAPSTPATPSTARSGCWSGATARIDRLWGYSPRRDADPVDHADREAGPTYLFVADADGRDRAPDPGSSAPRRLRRVGARRPDGRGQRLKSTRSARSGWSAVDGTPADDRGPRRCYARRTWCGGRRRARSCSSAPTHQGRRTGLLSWLRADGTLIRSFGPRRARCGFGADWDEQRPRRGRRTVTRIAYNRVDPLDGGPPAISESTSIRADGTGDITLPGPIDPLVQEAWPVWSPDGRWIAVEHFVFGAIATARTGWRSCRADGSGPRPRPQGLARPGWRDLVKTLDARRNSGRRLRQGLPGRRSSIDPVSGDRRDKAPVEIAAARAATTGRPVAPWRSGRRVPAGWACRPGVAQRADHRVEAGRDRRDPLGRVRRPESPRAASSSVRQSSPRAERTRR